MALARVLERESGRRNNNKDNLEAKSSMASGGQWNYGEVVKKTVAEEVVVEVEGRVLGGGVGEGAGPKSKEFGGNVGKGKGE